MNIFCALCDRDFLIFDEEDCFHYLRGCKHVFCGPHGDNTHTAGNCYKCGRLIQADDIASEASDFSRLLKSSLRGLHNLTHGLLQDCTFLDIDEVDVGDVLADFEDLEREFEYYFDYFHGNYTTLHKLRSKELNKMITNIKQYMKDFAVGLYDVLQMDLRTSNSLLKAYQQDAKKYLDPENVAKIRRLVKH